VWLWEQQTVGQVQKVINMPLSAPFRIDQLPLDTVFEHVCVALQLVLGKITKHLRNANNSFVMLVYMSTHMKQLRALGTEFSHIFNWVFLLKSAEKNSRLVKIGQK